MATVRDIFTIVFVAGLVFFTNLGGYPLFDEDEPKNAVCGREMLSRGDWIVPTFNEDLRTDKPILIYWVMLCSYHLFGVSEFAARFGSSLMSIGTCLGTYYLGRKLYDRQVGLLAAIVVATSLMFSAVGRAVTPDATLVCCLTWVFCGVVEGFGLRVESQNDSRQPIRSLFTTRYSLLAYAAMGFAMLAKGPVGFVLPCTAIGLFGLCSSTRDDFAYGTVTLGEGAWWRKSVRWMAILFAPRRFLQTLWSMKLWIGIPIAFGIALPWYLAVGYQTQGAWLVGFLGGHNVDRFLRPMEQHRGWIIYYLPVLFAGTFPWSIFLPLAIREMWQRVKTRAENSQSDLFLACWAGTWLVFFSLAQTKLPNYILPIYPAVALILARSLIHWMRDFSVGTRDFLIACRFLAGIGGIAIVGLVIAMIILLPREIPLALLGSIPIFTAAGAFYFAKQQQRQRAVITWATGAVVLSLSLMGGASVRLGPYQDSPFFAEKVHQAASYGEPEVATYEFFEPSLVFYHGRKVHRPMRPNDLTSFFEEHPEGFVLTRADKQDRLPPDLAETLVEVARQKRFLRHHDLVLLGRPTVIATGHQEQTVKE